MQKDSINSKISTMQPVFINKCPRKQQPTKKPSHDPVIPKKLFQPNSKYCIASSTLHELFSMPDLDLNGMDAYEIHQ